MLASLTLAACAGSASPGARPRSAVAPASQADEGQKIYAERCARCHGPDRGGRPSSIARIGEGAFPLAEHFGGKRGSAPALHTGRDVFFFIKTKMPPDAPSSLTDAECGALVAYLLDEHGMAVAGKTIDATTASTFLLPP